MNNIFWAIIIGAVIIGAGVYFGLKSGTSDIPPISKMASEKVDPRAPQDLVKSDLTTTAECSASDSTIVTKVIDGDTVVVEGGWHVRLLGIDADESGYPCYQPAKTRLESLILGKKILLEKDKTGVDQYGRCLRYIFLGDKNIDTQLVYEGLAIARLYEPDVKYRAQITSAEAYAQSNKIGCKWDGTLQTIK